VDRKDLGVKMAHDVFISYSVKDKNVADAVCANLEAGGIRCWIAPRDIRPGGTWAEEIVQAIGGSRALVLIFSSHSDNSEMVNRELDIATDHRLAIIPFRIEDITPSGQTRFYLAGKHWLDAMTPPLEQHLESLVAAVQPLLNLVGQRKEVETSGEGVGPPPGALKEEAAAWAAPASLPRVEPQPQAATDAKSSERRFKLKRWHYVVGLAVFGLIIILLVVPRLIHNTAQNAKLASAKSCMMNAELALANEDFTLAIFKYEMAMKVKVDPEFASELEAQIKSGLAEVYYRRGMKLQGQGELKKAVEDLEKAASLGGVRLDPRFMADLKKAAAEQARSQKRDEKPGVQPQ
jgi:hypothetical protein